MRISDGSSDVCSSDLGDPEALGEQEDERGVDIVDALPELRQRLVGHRWGSFARSRGLLGMRRCARNPKRLPLTPFPATSPCTMTATIHRLDAHPQPSLDPMIALVAGDTIGRAACRARAGHDG